MANNFNFMALSKTADTDTGNISGVICRIPTERKSIPAKIYLEMTICFVIGEKMGGKTLTAKLMKIRNNGEERVKEFPDLEIPIPENAIGAHFAANKTEFYIDEIATYRLDLWDTEGLFGEREKVIASYSIEIVDIYPQNLDQFPYQSPS